jgi:ribulose-phosphate 3-epimerase
MEIVSFHVEAVDDPAPVIRKAREARLGVGLTVSPETPVEATFPFLEDIDDVMVMSVHPGWSGQAFIAEALPKLERVRAEITRRGLDVDVEVDGGVKQDNARRCVEAGANVLVVASGIFQQTDVAGAAARLKSIVEAA